MEWVPVEASVAEIFWATKPGLPMPVSTTCPLQARIHSTAVAKRSSRRRLPMARDSVSSTMRP